MFDRLDQFANTLPKPQLGDNWDAYYHQHVRNAERMRSEAFKQAVLDLGRGLRASGRLLAAPFLALRQRAPADIAQSNRPATACGAD